MVCLLNFMFKIAGVISLVLGTRVIFGITNTLLNSSFILFSNATFGFFSRRTTM